MTAKVAGYCPVCGGETLFLGAGGYITCSRLECPRPDAASEILGNPETEHIVHIGRVEFTVLHPLRERLGGELLRCKLDSYLRGLSAPPMAPGMYRATLTGKHQWRWDAVDAALWSDTLKPRP